MRALPPFICCVLLAFTVAIAFAADSLQLAPKKGVVLLRNGQVLEGTISHAGDYYYVVKPGGEIRLKTALVEKVASRLEDLYEEKRTKLDPNRLHDRLDLAEWCVEQKLVDQAANELAEAAQLEPGHPRIPLIQRRLDLAQRTDAEKPVIPHAADSGPSTEELDRFVRGLPSHAVETFTSTIQPLLVNNCTKVGCHGPQSAGKLRLLRLPLSGTVSRRCTQRNLYAAWQVIDPDRPAASPILTQPVHPHGNAKAAIFPPGRETAQYRQLVSWVYDMTRHRRPPEPSDDAAGQSSQQPLKNERKKQTKTATAASPSKLAQSREAHGQEQAGIDESEGTTEVEPAIFIDDRAAAEAVRGQGDREEDYRPVDPFDPEVFNRRYFPR